MKREVAFLPVNQKMREEMDLAWKDFFEKNPGKKEEDVWRRVLEQLRSQQNSKGSIAAGEIAALVQSILLEKGSNADGSTEAYALRRRETTGRLILKRRIWWESVPEASSYRVYVSKDRTTFEPASFSWERTPGMISKLIIGKTEFLIPDEWPEFPSEPGTYYIGITSIDDAGNQSEPLLLSGLFKFFAPSAPLRGGIEYL